MKLVGGAKTSYMSKKKDIFDFSYHHHFERSVWKLNRNILAENDQYLFRFSTEFCFSYSELFLSWVGRKPPPSFLTDMCRPQSDSKVPRLSHKTGVILRSPISLISVS